MMPPPGQPGFMDLAQLDAQRDKLQGQMLDARAMGVPSGKKYGTYGGAIAGGMGDILGGIAGKSREAQLAEALGMNAQRQKPYGPSPAPPTPTGY